MEMLEFSSTLLSTLSPYLCYWPNNTKHYTTGNGLRRLYQTISKISKYVSILLRLIQKLYRIT